MKQVVLRKTTIGIRETGNTDQLDNHCSSLGSEYLLRDDATGGPKENVGRRCDFIPQTDGKLGEDRNYDNYICVTRSTSGGRGKHSIDACSIYA